MAQKNVNIANQSTGVQAYTSNPGSYTALEINNAINSSSTTPPASPLSIAQGDTIEMICYEGQSQFSVEFRVDPDDTFIPGNTGEQASGTDTNNTSGQTWATLPTTGTWTVTSANTGTYSMKIVQRTYTDPKASLVTNTKYLWFTVTSSGSAPTSFTTQPSWNNGNANSGATASLSTSPVANGSPAPTYSYSESSSLLSINSSTGVITWSSANDSTSSRTATVTCTATNASGSLNTNRTVTQLGGPGVSGTYTYSQEVSSGGTESPTGSPTFTGTAGNWAVTSAGGSSSNGATINTSNGTITWTSNSGSSSRSVTVYRSITRNGYSRWLSVGTASQEGSGGSGGTTTGTITEAQTYSHVRTEGSNYITTASSGATRTIFDVSTQASTGTASVTNTINSNSHTISYNPAATGTYTFTIRRRDQSAYYDSFAEFWLWQTDTTTLYDYSITVNPSAPSADTSVTVGQTFTSGASATGTVTGSGGSGGTVYYILKTSSSTPTAGDAAWQTSNTYTGLTRGTTYYGWTKRSNVSGDAVSVSGSKTMDYNAPASTGQANNPNDNSGSIELNSAQSFLVKFRNLVSTSQYRLIGPSGTARDWFTPSGNETNSTGVNTTVSWAGAGTYTLQSRRPIANGGNNTTTANTDTLSVTTPVSATITSTSLVGDDDTINVSGNIQNLSASTDISYTVTRGDTGATIASGTCTAAEDNEAFNVNIAGVHTSSSITFTVSYSGGIYSGSASDTTTILLRPTNLTFANDGDLSATEDVTVTGSGGSNGTIQVSNDNSTWVVNGTKIDQSRNSTVTYYARRVSGAVASGSYSETHYVGYLSPDSSISDITNQVLAFGSTSTTVSIAGGNSVDQYRVNNSNSSSATDYGTRTGNGSITISGSELPGNGYSRTYYVWARRPAASGGNNIFVLTNESFTIGVNATPPTDYTTNPVWSNGNANSGATSSITTSPVANWDPSGTISYSTSSSNVSSINSSTGQITWNANEGTANRTATITVTANNSSLVGGGTYNENFTATQLGGASVGLSYSNVNANVTTQNDSTTGTYNSISYAKISGSSAGSVNSSTGVVTWSGTNEGTSSRSITVRATASRNGDTDTVDATATQLGGSSITSFSYPDASDATAQDLNDTTSGTYTTARYAINYDTSETYNLLRQNFPAWTTGTGSATGYGQNGDGNSRITDTDPYGNTSIVWNIANQDATSDADGGWNSSTFNVDSSKKYRFSVWVRRKTIGNGRFYLGCYGRNSAGSNIGVLGRDNGSNFTNPYFYYSGATGWITNANEWVQVVGHIWPVGSGTGAIDPNSGIFDTNGTKIASIYRDFVWATGTAKATHRSYLYYSTDTSTHQQMWNPKVEDIESFATIDPTTGTLSWAHNENTASRTATVLLTVDRNGDIDTSTATSTQPGGASVSLSYSNVNANVTTQNDVTGGTYSSISYSKVSGSTAGSVNLTTGVVTWSGVNEGTSDRSIVVRATASRNGDTDTVDATATQLGGASITAFSYPDASNATAQNLNETIAGTYDSVSYSIVSGTGATVNASNGTLSWTHNEGSAARTVTVRATVTRNGDTDTADATSTQPGGATVSLSYSNVNANVTTQNDTTGGTYSSISYSKVSGDAAGSVNSTTGVVTWSSANEGTSNRSITVRATASRNGDTDTVDATATQLGGASITAFSYPDASNATAQNLNETISGTYSTVSYAIVSGSGATVNSSDGTLSWTHNESSSSRSVTVRATVTRNGDVDTADATSTQPGGATVSLSYANVNSNITTQNDTTGGTYSSISYSKVSGDAAGSVNSTTGVVTWSSANEGSSNRSITVRATASRNGDTDTVDATATQLGGAVITSFSYPDATNATAQDLNETISGTYSTVSYAIVSGSGATVNSSNGTLSWTHNESTSSRSVTVRATVTRNGDTDTADATSTQPGGASVSLSYANVNSNVTTQNDTTGGTYDSISYSKLSGSANGSVNSTTGVVTWDSANEGTSSRSITVRATASRNGDTDTVDATATQLGGSEITAFSYGSTNAAAGSVIPSYSGTGTVSFAYQSGSTAYTSINSTTGEVTWPINEGSASRSVIVRATTTRNGDIDTADATCTQNGGATISLSYTNANANTTTQNPTVSGTYDSISYSKQSGSSNGTVNTTTGVVTWDSTNEATSNRSIVVRATVSRNGDTDIVDATATQLGGASITSFSYANKNATSGTVSPSITATGTVTYSKVSGSTAASVNASTGVVTWSANEAASNRSATIRATVSRNGDIDTLDATTTQLAGAVASVSYPTIQPDQTTATPTLGGTGSYSNFELNPNPSYASIDASTGVITWDLHQGTSDRSVTVQGQIENNGDVDTFSVTATQSGSANPTVSITGVADTTPNENTSDQVVASTTVGTNVNITGYSWTSTGPVSLSSTTVSNPTVTFGNVTQNTAASITVTVTDSTGRTAQATQNYTIQLVNNAPTATLVVPGTGSVTYEVPCSVQGAYDTDGHALTFAFSVDDSGGTERFSQAASSSTEFSFTPTFADTYTVYMTVADGFGGSNQYSSQCVVTVGGPPPTGSNGGWGLELVNANNQVVLRSDELLVRKRTTTSSTSTSVSVPEANTEVFVASTGSSSSSSSSETWSVTGTTTKTVTKSGTGDTTLFIFK